MEYLPRPHGQKVISIHWFDSVISSTFIKVDEHRNVNIFKARLVANGCRHIPGIDVDEVFAPTSSFGVRRALLAVAVAKSYELHQFDIKLLSLMGIGERFMLLNLPVLRMGIL